MGWERGSCPQSTEPPSLMVGPPPTLDATGGSLAYPNGEIAEIVDTWWLNAPACATVTARYNMTPEELAALEGKRIQVKIDDIGTTWAVVGTQGASVVSTKSGKAEKTWAIHAENPKIGECEVAPSTMTRLDKPIL